MTITTRATRTPATGSRRFRHQPPRHRCRNIRSPTAPAMVICGRRDIGAILLRDTTGYPVHGRGRPTGACWGRRATGDLPGDDTATTTGSGAGISAITAALTMDSATSGLAMKGGTGKERASI